MNTLDMYTREKANTIHLKKMHHDAKERRLIHKARQDSNLEGAGARWPMNTKYLFILLILLISLLVSGCASSAPANPADRFTGTWSGTMSFTDDANRKEDIIVTIPAGCAVGGVCGDLNNTTVNCKWEMTLVGINADVFAYKFSKTLSGECPALGGGTLTLQSDGTLMREHKTPNFTASGVLTGK